MPKLPACKPSTVLRALLRAGFRIHHQTGSHVQLRHHHQPHLRVTIPSHARFDLPPHVVTSILKQSGLSRDEFLDLL